MADKAGMIRWFLEELPGLRESGIINPDTEENLKGYYLARLAAAPSPQKYFLLALSIIGGLLITAGTVLIFNYNWDILGKNLQIAVSFLPLAAAFCLSVFTLAGRRGQAWRECSALATAAGASIAVALLSHIYHTGGDFREFMMLILLFSVPLIYLFNSISLTAVYSIMLFSQLSWRTTDQAICLALLGAVLPMILYHLLKENSPYRKAMRYIAMDCVLFGLFVFSKEGPLPLFTATSLFFLCGIRVYERKENIWGNPWLILSFVTLTALLGIGSSGAWSCISFPAAKIVTIYGLFEGLLLAAFAGVFAYDAVKKRITAERILLITVTTGSSFPGNCRIPDYDEHPACAVRFCSPEKRLDTSENAAVQRGIHHDRNSARMPFLRFRFRSPAARCGFYPARGRIHCFQYDSLPQNHKGGFPCLS